MNGKLVFLAVALALASGVAIGDEESSPPPAQHALAPAPNTPNSAKNATTILKPMVRRVPSPTVSEMSVVRLADGSLVTGCIQVPNPKLTARAPMLTTRKAVAEPQS